MAYNWAVNVHPDLMRWYRDAAQATHAKCRTLRINNGVDEVTEVEQLVLRDLNVFTAAIDAHLSLPAEMQKRVIDLAEPVHANTALFAPMRLASVAARRGPARLGPGLARRDRNASAGYAGEVIQTPAVIDGFQSRIDNLEESVQLMMNRFIAISAATEIPDAYRQRSRE